MFAAVVAGITGTGDIRTVGRIGLKALAWFVAASLVSLLSGMTLANLFQPGANLKLPLPDAGLSTNLRTGGLSLKEFIVHVFPKSFFEAMATNEILQILVFSIFFGIALADAVERTLRALADSREIVRIYNRWFERPLPSGQRLDLPMNPQLRRSLELIGLPPDQHCGRDAGDRPGWHSRGADGGSGEPALGPAGGVLDYTAARVRVGALRGRPPFLPFARDDAALAGEVT